MLVNIRSTCIVHEYNSNRLHIAACMHVRAMIVDGKPIAIFHGTASFMHQSTGTSCTTAVQGKLHCHAYYN